MLPPGEFEKHARMHMLTKRLHRCAAILTASRRREEVVAVVGEAADDAEATEAVSELLEVDAEAASAVVGMPVQSFNQERVARLEDEARRLAHKVAQIDASSGLEGNGER